MQFASFQIRHFLLGALFVAAAMSSSPAISAERAKNITFDHLKFDLKSGDPFERSMLGKSIEALHDKPIVVRGYIFPSFSAKVNHFVLTRDNRECCFGPGAALCDSIQVHLNPGKTTEFTIYPVAVEGVLTIREFKDVDGVVRSVYHLQATKVK